MILITKQESEKVREKYSKVCISRTSKQKSSRHCYYLEESDKYLELIADTNEQAKEILRQHKKYNLRFYQN
jgi:hypothetical protein